MIVKDVKFAVCTLHWLVWSFVDLFFDVYWLIMQYSTPFRTFEMEMHTRMKDLRHYSVALCCAVTVMCMMMTEIIIIGFLQFEIVGYPGMGWDGGRH
ncbi:hypothetical protein Dimus_034830 [Dionaea muscipula]